MEQVGSGARQKRRDAKPFYVNVTVIRNWDFRWRDGERYMPTQSEVAQIRKSSVLGQYKKQVEFYRNMSEKMVMEKLEETFPYLRRKSYACTVLTSRPAGCMSTSRIWDGKTIKKNTQGNSALYILEDEVTQMNDSSAYLDQPKSKHRHDKLTSLDQSQKVTNELSSLEIGARAISGQEEQPTSCGSHPRSCTSHRTSGSWLALKEFSRAETSGAENRALQGVTRLPQNQKTFSSTSTPQMNTSNDLAVASQRSHELCLVEAMETSQQFCSNKTATEDLNLWLADPHPSHGASRPDSRRPDTIEGILFQNTTLPSRPRAMLTSETPEVYYSAGFSSDILTTNGNSVFDISLPLEDLLPYDDIPDHVKFDFTVGPKKVPAEIPGCEDYVMTDNNDQTGTSKNRDCQLPYQGSSLNSTEMSDSSADYVNTTSGISELGHNSLDDLSLNEDEHFDFSVTPKKVPLQGGALCRFSSSRAFPRNLQSAFAIFEILDTVEVKRFGEDSLIGEKIPPSKTPGWVTIFLQRADGTKLGETKIWYYDEDKEALQRIINNPKLQADFFRNFSEMLSNRNSITASGAEAQNSGICDSTEPVQMLCVLVYAAVEIGGQQFIEMIFNSSAGRVVYDCYKDSSALPEAIAREYGHEMTACFLEEITGRFSKEASEAQNYPQIIDWSELVRAAEKAQKQPGLSTEEESNHLESNVVKYKSYLGDIETSPNESCESGRSDSEYKIPWATSKGSSFSDLSSDASSQMFDERSGRVPFRKRIKYRVNVKHLKGRVAIGPHARARIKGDEQVSTETGQFLDDSRSEEGNSDNCDGLPNGDIVHQRHVENEAKANTKSGRAILFNKGESTYNLSNEDFLKNPGKFIEDMDDNAGPLKAAKEDLLLHSILPYLEETWGKCPSCNNEVYKNLAKISCSAKCGKAVSQALQLLLHLICKDNFDNCHNNLLVVEAIVRSSILSSEGLFRRGRVDSGRETRELKLCVYSRIISLLVTHQALKGDSSINCLKQDLKKIKYELKKFSSKMSNKKKDGLRYSTEFIIKAISNLLQPSDKLRDFLDECREFCRNQEIKVNDLRALRRLKYKRRGDWRIDLHYIAIYLQGKVHSERPTQRMETERRAMNLLRSLVEKYLDGNGGLDWRFCMLAATIFSDISMKNETKEIRTEAGSSLVYLLKDSKVQKTPECKAIVQSQSEKALFCPDVETRTFLTHFFNKNENGQVELDTMQCTKHLSWKYRTQTLEIKGTTISKSSTCFVYHGRFQRRKVAVKVLLVKKQHLLEENTPDKESLKREAENLRLLNVVRHPNFPVLLTYSTKTLPYHLITAFEKSGDLLQFVQRSRRTNPPIQPVQLIKMLLDITDALLFLEEEGLVHRAVMAANVLVGDSYICKLSGMQHLRQLTSQTEDSDSVYSYCSLDDDFPEFVNSGNEEELPLRWKAPEVLSECRFSTASDVWALGVLMYEVLTYGCLPYGLTSDSEELCSRVKNGIEILPFESCFEENEYKLMQQCFQFQRRSRPQLLEVKSSLCEMIENADEEQVRSDPPPLTACGSFPARNTEDINRASGAVYEECTSQSIEESYTMPNDPVYEECTSRSADKGPDVSNGPYYVHNLTSDKERVEEKLFNRNPLLDLDDLPRQRQTGRTSDSNVIEKIKRTADHHLRDLLTLKHPNLVTLKIENLDSHCPTANIITEEAPLGNLKNYVLEKQCQIGDIVTFLSQVASAMHYLHENHIVHGDLRATYVNVVSHDKITVGRLGRSKPLNPSEYDVTSTSCVVQVAMHPDATRWSAPEVILDGRYTHASDVWSFGILAWELYTSFANGLDGRDSSLPFFDLDDQKILPHIRDNGPPDKPEGCPEWVYIIIHQCWAYVAQQRPPFLAIFDCLTSRVPMESWIMKLWLKTHDKSEWPDLSTCQSQDAYHVTCLEQHPSSDIIEKMCSPDFFSRHEYKYVCRNFGMAGGKDDYSEANGTPDVPFTGDISPVYSSCSKVKKNLELVPVPEPQKAPNNNDAGYLCPVSITVEDLSSTESNEENDAGVAESTRGDGRERVVPAKETFNLQVKKVKKRSGAHGSSAIDMNGGKASLPADTLASLYVNLGTQPDQQHTSLYQNIDAIPKETSSKNEEYVEGTKAACPNPTEKRNRAVYPKVKKAENTPGLEDQLVPPNHPLYANLVASGELQVTYFV